MLVDNIRVEPGPPAACVMRNGNGRNPIGFRCTSAPVLGQLWTSTVATVPATAWTGIAIGVPAPPQPGFGGEILVAPFDSQISLNGSFSVAMPNNAALLGLTFSAQGVRVDTAPNLRIVLLNAQDLILGL